MESNEYPIAGVDDVRRYWTKVMDGVVSAPIQYGIKASEMLARSYGMFREVTEEEKQKPENELDMSGYTMEELRRIAYGDELT